MNKAGFREVAHTADWELAVWAETLADLLIQSTRGMYALSGVQMAARGRRRHRLIHIEAAEPEQLLVRFLGEVLHFAEHERLAFDVFDMQIEERSGAAPWSLSGTLSGRKINAQNKEIKAVTYHNLYIHQTEDGPVVNIVFDV